MFEVLLSELSEDSPRYRDRIKNKEAVVRRILDKTSRLGSDSVTTQGLESRSLEEMCLEQP
jgi:hypothetical protein